MSFCHCLPSRQTVVEIGHKLVCLVCRLLVLPGVVAMGQIPSTQVSTAPLQPVTVMKPGSFASSDQDHDLPTRGPVQIPGPAFSQGGSVSSLLTAGPTVGRSIANTIPRFPATDQLTWRWSATYGTTSSI